MTFRPISIFLSPNTEKDDVQLASKLLFKPWLWKKGKEILKFEEKFKKYLGARYAFSFNSGRSSLIAILEAMDIKKGDEVLLQGFTCNAAVNPILAKEAKPIFVDVDETINMNPEDLKTKITKNSKIVMIQHTFGWPAKIEEIKKITQESGLYLIEDCAHSLGAKYLPSQISKKLGRAKKLCGTFSDAAFFSFGRDKIISCVYGGMAVTNNKKIGENLKEFQKKMNYPSNFWIVQQLLHPVLMNYLILPFYNFLKLGRIFLALFLNLRLLSKSVVRIENRGELPSYFPQKLPNALTLLALNQFKKIERFNQHRQDIAKLYKENLEKRFILPFAREDKNREPIFMRYPLLVDDSDKILTKFKRRGIYLDDAWRKSPIVPPATDLKKIGYIQGSCCEAEKIAKHILNLPTHINISPNQAQKIIKLLLNAQ